MTHKFSVRCQSDVVSPINTLPLSRPNVFVGHNRYRKDLLQELPLDLLVVERGTFHQPPSTLERRPRENLVYQANVINRPKVVIKVWASLAQVWNRGPMSKACVSRWKTHDYVTHCRLIKETSVGGVIQQDRLLISRV
jgi:hypothetical protein